MPHKPRITLRDGHGYVRVSPCYATRFDAACVTVFVELLNYLNR